ncbi:TAXI family TRAP transporter solute-binding subunit [Achromobacter sp. GG226]|uniref:TAXI family TRAP transporter solute-binding subunit n=1 Tax=Verticiella alkaliphila TaxID=2779529 RepID=UPI001C0C3A65|nr:TAXI family TRAP transporter solute-binding subunit [Verticiella sp. GG226]MBU4612496.1 TAXI family TRAP transporter solute-binding subunit [Verticiella sp. GG226]
MFLRRLLLSLLLLTTLAACSSAPDETAVSRDVAERVGSAFEDNVLEVTSLHRLGSAPAPAAADGTTRRIVYYNAVLTLSRDYAFNDWEALNPQSLANLLGATPRGITGLSADGNRAGDTLRVRGSITYRAQDDGWRPVAVVRPAPTQAPTLDAGGPAGQARGVIERIQALFDRPPAAQEPARAIITEELEAAYRQIALRLERLERAFVVAGGPAGGEYDALANAMAAFGNQRGIRSAAVQTQGSLENLSLLVANRADAAIVQNDVAARYVAEHASSGPQAIRALGSLFPEPLHIVVRADSDIDSVAALRGRRVDLGLPDSGTRRTAERVLSARGVALDTIDDPALGSIAAAQALRRGEIDAFAAVINAPARFLQELATDVDIRLLPVMPAQDGSEPGLVPIVMPQGTYPGQAKATPTLAVAALLVSRADLDDETARSLVDSIYHHIDFPALGSGAGGQIAARNARLGISIPLHEGLPVMGTGNALPGEITAPRAPAPETPAPR